MNYNVKNVKTGPSREYGPKGSYTCNLYDGNKKIAEVFEAGDGGCLEVRWVGKRTESVRFGNHTQMVTPEQLAFAKFAESQTYICEHDGKTETYDSHTFIASLADDFLTNKQIKGWCRTKTVIRMKGQGEGEYSTFKCKFSPRFKAQLEARYGDKIVEFVNERFVA